MSLGLDDVYRIAELAHVGINEEAAQRMQAELNDIFKMIERIQAVDTEGVEPMVCAKTRWSSATTAKKT